MLSIISMSISRFTEYKDLLHLRLNSIVEVLSPELALIMLFDDLDAEVEVGRKIYYLKNIENFTLIDINGKVVYRYASEELKTIKNLVHKNDHGKIEFNFYNFNYDKHIYHEHKLIGRVLIKSSANMFYRSISYLIFFQAIFICLLFLLIGAAMRVAVIRPIHLLIEQKDHLGSGKLDIKSNKYWSIELINLLKMFIGADVRINNFTKNLSKMNSALEIKTIELEENNNYKEDFIANMTHEIRTPMNGILGYLELLEISKLNNTQKEMIRSIRTCCTFLSCVVNDILDISKVDSNNFFLQTESFNVHDCIEKAILISLPIIADKPVEIKFEKDCEQEYIFKGDDVRVSQILINLVANAMKFTVIGKIIIKMDIKRDQKDNKNIISISVRDTGIGISKKNKENIFEDFTQADSSITRKYGGTGLGLSLSKRLVNKMGGSILCHSVLGEGSTFILELPLESGNRDEDDRNQHKIEQIHEEMVSEIVFTKILVVDDNVINRKLMKAMLLRIGFDCDLADSGKMALENIKQLHPAGYELIFMDIMMPEMNGVETTKIIFEEYGFDKCHIVALTANAEEINRKLCFDAGMVDYLIKPIELKTLRELLKKYFDVS